MTIEQLSLLAIVLIVVAIMMASKNRPGIRGMILNRLNIFSKAEKRKPDQPVQSLTGSDPRNLTEEESKVELERLQKLIEDRKQFVRDTDISHHLWGLYRRLLHFNNPHSLDRYSQDGEWYDVKILHNSSENGLHKLEFELKGGRYKFVDDEEKQGWCENMKFFSLYLHDDSDRCLIQIPMKMKVDSSGRRYSILSNGPEAFLSGGWVSDFINVNLKHQSIRNQEIRAQKHQERLFEIEDLKDRFGISD